MFDLRPAISQESALYPSYALSLSDRTTKSTHCKSSQVDLVLLLPRGVEEVHELDDVAVLEAPHDLQLAVLEALVLQHLLDRHHLPSLHQLRLVHHAEAAVADDLQMDEILVTLALAQ